MKKKYYNKLNLTTINYILLLIASLVIIISFIIMKYAGDDLGDKTISPILLTLAYLIIVPLALFYKKKER